MREFHPIRTHGGLLLLVAVLLAAVLPEALAGEGANPDRPNVLFISVDDMNDWIGCLGGYPDARTPNLDRLARRGVLFTNAHCAVPVCNPSRVALFTGLYASSSGVYDNRQWWRPALPKVVSIPEHFKAQGYHVAGGGKTFHWDPRFGGHNPPDQWHEYFDMVYDEPLHRKDSNSPLLTGLEWPPGFPLNGLENVRQGRRPPWSAQQFDWGPVKKTDDDMGDGRMIRWAVDFLGRRHEKPFFLAVGTFRPHLPWYAPRKYFDTYPLERIKLPLIRSDDLDDLPQAGRRTALHRSEEFAMIVDGGLYRQAVRAYLASIAFVDALVGRLIDALDRSRYAEETIIVLWSDHGFHLGEKRHWHKYTLWERATRVPVMIVAPGVTRRESRCHRPVSLVDLYPTLIELCGLEPNPRLDGQSLVPLLREPDAAWERPALTTLGRGDHALRDERWRYIRYADGSEELYDHNVDPHEWTNLADKPEFAAVKKRLSRWLPRADALRAPGMESFRFEPDSYRWTRKPEAPKKPTQQRKRQE